MSAYSNLYSLQDQLGTDRTTCVEIVEYYLENIEASKHLNIYVEIFANEALERAKFLDKKLADKSTKMGPLYGLVVSIKDVLCYKDHVVTAGSKMLEGFNATYSATAIERLIAGDAIIIGRVNCDEFAMGSSNENSYYGPTINGIGDKRIPGGSSGASAVSVQMDTCMIAIGSDTGGSVRQPAGFCGVIGFKPTYGRISRYGLIAYGSSFDQIGIIGKNIRDVASTLHTISGPDQFDSTVTSMPVPDYVSDLKSERQNLRIGIFENVLNNTSVSPDIKTASKNFIKLLERRGHQVDEIPFDLLEYAVPAYYVLTTAEASSNLARYDGIRFGYKSPNAISIHDVYTHSRTEGFGEEVKRRIMLGTFVLSSGYYEAYYGKAQKVRKLLTDRINGIFEQYDLIVLPVAPSTAWEIGSKSEDPIQVYLSDIFTVIANLTGIPGISIPVGVDFEGMPIGMQVMGPKFSETLLLSTTYNLLK
ncbi:MAG: Asp-tRNA(Asn)/Glu-tRNA(Gln) amidotransferase subunit GatA [Bacteroidia bacterium]|nr:Asp-tRNA(Asn)/Glu-tRNA(Gln) amidotransferase subunit GatA [Bacteroidia bacterium]